MNRRRYIPHLDDESRDERIYRCMGRGWPPTPAPPLTGASHYDADTAFGHRLRAAVTALREGASARDLTEIHGRIVVEAAREYIRERG